MIRIRRILATGGVVALALAATAHGQPAQPTPEHAHTMVNPATIQWSPGPPSTPAGAMVSILSGDPSKDGPFVARIKLPDGWKIGPHFHPTDESLTVLKGTFLMALGEKFDKAALKPLVAGGFAQTSAKTPHYAAAKGETIVQIHGNGPFTTTYVDPADDPRTKGKTNE